MTGAAPKRATALRRHRSRSTGSGIGRFFGGRVSSAARVLIHSRASSPGSCRC
ncbi:hypothetical protein [Actinacidiphila oryziradicis]|uniref:hypothetical protein n=1 Tax=Actinacidiphila oryziradicis TaxID=2571141 RepID=UPI0023F2B6D6|nr:hypothetical protein [Actinacidiphila oryziradicis]